MSEGILPEVPGPDGATEDSKSDSKPEDKEPTDESRREFIKVAATVSAGLALVGIASVMKAIVIPSVAMGSQATIQAAFPRVKVSNLSELSGGEVVIFNYPLDNEPNLLVKLGKAASGGVGPDGDVVAFSQLCQHLGCLYGFVPAGGSPTCKKSLVEAGPVGYCCCHGSVYDFANGAKVLSGPSPRPVPQVTLEVEGSGDIFAVGMSGPSIFGHNTGSDDVANDLQGGNLV